MGRGARDSKDESEILRAAAAAAGTYTSSGGKKLVLYPHASSRGVKLDFDAIRSALANAGSRVLGASEIGNGGWIVRMESSEAVATAIRAAKGEGIETSDGERLICRPFKGDDSRSPSSKSVTGDASAQHFRSHTSPAAPGRKRELATTLVVACVEPPTKASFEAVVSRVREIGEVKDWRGPIGGGELVTMGIPVTQIEQCVGGKGHGSALQIELGGIAQTLEAMRALHCKRLPGLDRMLWARQLGGEGAKIKHWRTIVRNLPFKVNAKKLKSYMSIEGQLYVWEVHLPKTDQGRLRGFGFVGYTCRSDAERAIKLLNGSTLGGRVIVVDWAIGKREYQEGPGNPNETPLGPPPRTHDDDDDGDSGDDGDVVAGSGSEDADEDAPSDADEGPEAGGVPVDEEKAAAEESAMMQRIISSFQTASAPESGAAKASRPRDGGASPATTGGPPASVQDGGAIKRTVFVCSVPRSLPKAELEKFMQKFGHVDSCRMCLDKSTRKFTGKAFVEYRLAKSAEKAVAAHQASLKGKRDKLKINGQLINVYMALDKSGIQDLSDHIRGKANRGDKRNLYLKDEGYIAPDSSAAFGMSETDLGIRERSQKEKTEKLKSPNNYVSKTRLLIRNLPSELTKNQLRALCLKAVRERATKAKPKIVQCKILYEEHPTKKTLKSSERGFVEFEEHEHAVCCLRMLNNNPTTFAKSRRPIVEFAIENALKLRKREIRMMHAKARKEANETKEKSGGGNEKGKGEGKGRPDHSAGNGKRNAEGGTPKPGQDEEQTPRGGKPKRRRDARGDRGNASAVGTKSEIHRDTNGAGAKHDGGGKRARRGEERREAVRKAKDAERPRKRPPKGEKSGGGERAKKSKRQKGEGDGKADKLDSLIASYQTKFFDDSLGKNVKRWFE